VAVVGLEEKYDAVRQLIAVGKERGYLLYDEVNDSLPAEVHSSEEIDDLLTTFERNGIEIYEDAASAKAARAVEVSVEPGLSAEGDHTLMRMVLQNLLGNAFKFSAHTRDARIQFGRRPDGDHAFFVRDNGAGFDMRFADRLFGVFQRLHSQSEFAGTGVGLATVHRIVRRHYGRIWAESEPGKGATFFFTMWENAAPPAG